MTRAGCGARARHLAAQSPARLWPDLTPAASPAYDIGEVDNEVVKGRRRARRRHPQADPVAAVRAEITAHPDDYEGDKAPYRETARRMADCGLGR